MLVYAGLLLAVPKYRGVHWERDHKKWRAVFRVRGKRAHIGYFDNEEDAARAYDNTLKEAPTSDPRSCPLANFPALRALTE